MTDEAGGKNRGEGEVLFYFVGQELKALSVFHLPLPFLFISRGKRGGETGIHAPGYSFCAILAIKALPYGSLNSRPRPLKTYTFP